jgi:hypothetical protein
MKENSIEKSYIALTQAIAHISITFENIAFPIKPSFFYDIIAEKNDILFKIRVIYTNCKAESGAYVATLRKMGKNVSGKIVYQPFDSNSCDYIYVHTPECCYLIPANEINQTRAITLSMFEKFKIFIPS